MEIKKIIIIYDGDEDIDFAKVVNLFTQEVNPLTQQMKNNVIANYLTSLKKDKNRSNVKTDLWTDNDKIKLDVDIEFSFKSCDK